MFNTKSFSKFAQSYFGTGIGRPHTLNDLYNAIRADAGLGVDQKAQIINQVKGLTSYADGSTSLESLMTKGLGGAIGWLISKYFGMGAVGQLVSTMAGYGIGSLINKHLNEPSDPLAGSSFRMIR